MTGDSYNLVGSGILPILQAKGRKSRILVISSGPSLEDALPNSLSRAWLTRSRPLGGIRGFWSSGYSHAATTPFTKVDTLPTNLTRGVYLYAFHRDQPNSPGMQEGLFYDTASDLMDGTGGRDSVTLNGGQEYRTSRSANIALDAPILTCTLNSGYSPLTTPNWDQRALTVKAFLQVPDADPSGAAPLSGGPSLKLGLRRGADAFTLGSASPLTTTLSLVTLSGTLSAGSGPPALSLNNGLNGNTQRARSFIPLGYSFENDTDEGLSIVHIANREVSENGWSGVGGGSILKYGFIQDLATALGGFDAVIYHCGEYISGGYSITGESKWVNLINELIVGDTGTAAESHSDCINTLHTEVGNSFESPLPILFISSWYAGQGSTDTERNTLRETFNKALMRVCSPSELTKDGGRGVHHSAAGAMFAQRNCALINLYPTGSISRCSQTGGGQICTNPTGGDFSLNSAGSDLFMDTIWSIIERAQNSPHYPVGPRTRRSLRTRTIK